MDADRIRYRRATVGTPKMNVPDHVLPCLQEECDLPSEQNLQRKTPHEHTELEKSRGLFLTTYQVSTDLFPECNSLIH